MAPVPKCCDPFKKKGHKNYRKNLTYLHQNCDQRLRLFTGLYICASCKTMLYNNKKPCNLDDFNDKNEVIDVENIEEAETDEEEVEVDSVKKDPDFVNSRIDNQVKRMKLASSLEKAILQPEQEPLSLSNNECRILKSISVNSPFSIDNASIKWISELKNSLTTSSREQKIFLLTTVPDFWSVRKTACEFEVSRRMVKKAKKLKKEKGYGVFPDKKKGRSLQIEILNEVKEFFLSDEVSRVMPGSKDYKSVIINDKRQHETVGNS